MRQAAFIKMFIDRGKVLIYLNALFTDRIKDGLLGGVVGLHQEVDTVQLSHSATENMAIDFVHTIFFLYFHLTFSSDSVNSSS